MDIERLREAAERGGKEEFLTSYMAQHFEMRDANGLRRPTGVWIEDVAQKWKEVVEDGRAS